MISEHLKTRLEQLHAESFGWALRCCQEDQIAAEEVLQMTYLKILEGKAQFAEKATFKTWLFSVIRFTAIDYFRKNKRYKQHVFNKLDISQIDTAEDGNQVPAALFKQVVNQLSPKQQQVLHLVFYQNLSIQEASEVMQIQVGTARTHYERGKQQLKKKLIEAGYVNNGKFINIE